MARYFLDSLKTEREEPFRFFGEKNNNELFIGFKLPSYQNEMILDVKINFYSREQSFN